MPLLREPRDPDLFEAKENLRLIRELMERSTRHSTFSGVSGVFAGTVSIAGCLVTRWISGHGLAPNAYAAAFLTIWASVVLLAIGADYFLTKRRAAAVGKRIMSRLGKQMFVASMPGLGSGAVITFYFLRQGLLPQVYPVWALCYGAAVCAVGLFSQREVSRLGLAFLVAGTVTLLLFPLHGLPMMALTFGGFHIVYGILMGRRDRW